MRLSNRLDAELQAKILAAVHDRVPMPTQDEIAALALERAKQHEASWQMMHVQAEGIVEAHKALRDGASKIVTEGEPHVAAAAEGLKAATARRERIQRGENVGVLGKPPSLKELGVTPADARHWRLMGGLSEEQFKRYLDVEGKRRHGPAARQREYAALRKYIGNLPADAFTPEVRDELVELLRPRRVPRPRLKVGCD
jgi:hypothetical protein